MDKKVLLISSSPRFGGNSDLLCDEFMKGARAAGNLTDKIFLKSKHVNYCTGCGTCYNGANPCPQRDDMAYILGRMISADVIVMASPIYFYSISAQLKTIIDRTCARYTEIMDKEFYFILTATDDRTSAMGCAVQELRSYIGCLDGAVEKGIVYGVGVWQPGDVQRTEAMKEAYRMGQSV